MSIKTDYHNLLIVKYKIDNASDYYTYHIELPRYNWKKDNPNDWTDSAYYTVLNFLERYTQKAGYNIIKDFDWCFAYIDNKYKGTKEHERRCRVLSILDL